MLALPHAELQTPMAGGAWEMHVAWAITQVSPPHTHPTVCMESQNEAPQGETDSGLLLCDLPESVFSSANWASRAAGGSEGARVSPLPMGHVRGQLPASGSASWLWSPAGWVMGLPAADLAAVTRPPPSSGSGSWSGINRAVSCTQSEAQRGGWADGWRVTRALAEPHPTVVPRGEAVLLRIIIL